MFGWEELAAKVARQYNALTPEQRQHTIIYPDNYGQAGALHHFGKQYNLPEPVCLASSFALWAPDQIDAQYVIFINSTRYWNATEVFTPMVESCVQVDSITNPYAVEKGTAILLLTHPKPAFFGRYKAKLAQTRSE